MDRGGLYSLRCMSAWIRQGELHRPGNLDGGICTYKLVLLLVRARSFGALCPMIGSHNHTPAAGPVVRDTIIADPFGRS